MSKNENSKICAILAYLLVGIIWYFADEKMRKDNFAKFHVKQGLLLLILGVGLSIVLSFVSAILLFIPFIGGLLTTLLWLVVQLGLMGLCIFGIVHAAQGKKEKVPIIGAFAQKIFTF